MDSLRAVVVVLIISMVFGCGGTGVEPTEVTQAGFGGSNPPSLAKPGSVTDPAGDASPDNRDDPANPDIVSASVCYDGTNLYFEVRFVAAGFSSATSRGTFLLDIDENPATGFPGIDGANNDSQLMGVDFFIHIGGALGAQAEVFRFVSLPNSFATVGFFSATVQSDGYDVTIPLSAFNNDDGVLNYKVVTQSYLSATTTTGILDYMPNLGLTPGRSESCEVPVEIDIRPGTCPNSFSMRSRGVLPVAILGRSGLNVNNIDASTVKLNGVSALRSNIADVATPVAARQNNCDCTTDGPDTFSDLVLRFDHQSIAATLGTVSPGDVIELVLTGKYTNGDTFQASDCIVIVGR